MEALTENKIPIQIWETLKVFFSQKRYNWRKLFSYQVKEHVFLSYSCLYICCLYFHIDGTEFPVNRFFTYKMKYLIVLRVLYYILHYLHKELNVLTAQESLDIIVSRIFSFLQLIFSNAEWELPVHMYGLQVSISLNNSSLLQALLLTLRLVTSPHPLRQKNYLFLSSSPRPFISKEFKLIEKLKEQYIERPSCTQIFFSLWISHLRVSCRHHGPSPPNISASVSQEQKRALIDGCIIITLKKA